MKIKSLLAVSILAAAAQSHAATYDVTGSLAAINTIGATSTPTLWIHPGSTTYSTAATTWPTFTGTWSVDPAAGAISGIFSDFEQYSTSIRALGTLTAVVDQPHLVYSFNGGTVTYDEATRTLTLGQTLVQNGPSTSNTQTSDATLLFDTANGSIPGVCSNNATICAGQAQQFLAKPDMERFYLTLTFSSDFSSFTGSAVGADVGGAIVGYPGTTGNTWYKWDFAGTLADDAPTVPVPAAAWLLGSGLAGLAGVARRRRAT
jgi:hypothetical protein